MNPKKFIAKVVAHRDLTSDVFEKTFELVEPAELNYDAGNYATVKIEDGKMPMVFRAYTFASCGHDPKKFKLIVKLFQTANDEPGRGGGFLKNLAVGESAEFFGPAGEGSFVPKGEESDPLWLLGTGTGIAPLFAVAEKLTIQKSPRPIQLFLGVSYSEDIFFVDELEKLKNDNPNFDFKITVSRPPENFTGLKGRIPAVIGEMEIPENLEALICGSEQSVAAAKEKLLELGVPAERIDAEGFGEA